MPDSARPAAAGASGGVAALGLRLLGFRPRGPRAARLAARVAGRTVVVTGASRGVGAETALRFARVGARLVLIARDRDALERVAERIRRKGGVADSLAVDLRDVPSTEAAARDILRRFGTPEVLISNAGHSIRRDLLDYADRAHDVERTIGVNYLGPVALVRVLAPAMVAAARGHIVSVGSTSIAVPAPGWSVYGASKSAFDAWLRAVAPELGPSGVAVTTVHLPLVRTAMSAPTAAYDALPAMRPVDAAAVIARAVVERPRLITPWWSRAAGGLLAAFPGLSDPMLRRHRPGADRS